MGHRVEDVTGCNKKIFFDYQDVDLASEVTKELKKKQETLTLKGFRKGKAPLSMVEKLFRHEVEDLAYRKFISNEFYNTIEEEKLKVVGQPQFSNVKYKENEVSFEALVEIFPEFELKDFSGIKVDRSEVEITEEDMQNVIKYYQDSKAELKEVKDSNHPVEKGDFVVLNYQGEKEDGEKPETMKGEEFLLEIGSNRFIPGFEEGLIGAKKGENVILDLTFPEEYHDKSLENAKVKFTVDVLEIKSKELPEVTDEFAKTLGHESVDDMNTKVKENLLSQKGYEHKQKVNQGILDELIKLHEFDVPASLIAMQKEALAKDISRSLVQQGLKPEMLGDYFKKWEQDLDDKAIFQVKSGLILEKLSEKFEISVSQKDLEDKYATMAKSMGGTVEDVRKYYSSNQEIEKNLKYAIREEKTFEAIISSLK